MNAVIPQYCWSSSGAFYFLLEHFSSFLPALLRWDSAQSCLTYKRLQVCGISENNSGEAARLCFSDCDPTAFCQSFKVKTPVNDSERIAGLEYRVH